MPPRNADDLLPGYAAQPGQLHSVSGPLSPEDAINDRVISSIFVEPFKKTVRTFPFDPSSP